MPDAFKIFYFISQIFDFTMIIGLKFDLKKRRNASTNEKDTDKNEFSHTAGSHVKPTAAWPLLQIQS